MAWAGGVPNTNITNMTGLAEGVNIYYDKRFLKRALHTVRFAPLGQKRPLPMNAGDTIEFFRYNEIGLSMSGAYLTDGTNPDATAITGQTIQAQLAEWGAFSQHSRLLSDTHIDRKLAGVIDLWGSHAGNTIDLQCKMAVATSGAYPMRADGNDTGDGAYSFDGVVEGTPSTTAITLTGMGSNTNFGDAADDANMSIAIVYSGT